MTHPCSEIERIIKSETIIVQTYEHVKSINEKLDELLEGYGNIKGRIGSIENNPSKPDNGFIMGVASVGALIGGAMVKIGAPALKPLLGMIGFIIK